jgi:rare lipoprotein A
MMNRPHAVTVITACCAVLFLSACAETQLAVHAAKSVANHVGPAPAPPVRTGQGEYKVGQPYQVAGVWYYPKEDPHYVEKGIASWYGRKFHGRPTANGEVYDMNALTAAHKTLPMPTKVRVTNLENGRALVLRVNDRGPFVHGRIIDVSRRAAQLLGFINNGTARVRVEALAGSSDTFVARKPLTTEEERQAVAAVPQGGVTAQTLAPPSGVAEAPVKTASAAPTAPVARVAASEPDERGVVSREPVRPSVLYVQAGAFIDVIKARVLRQQMAPIGDSRIVPVFRDGVQFYRVRIGPLSDVASADRTLEQVIQAGHPEARIVVVD